jgi:CRISPR-associated endonuclease/helicase Cas3
MGKFALAIDGHHGGLRSNEMLRRRLATLKESDRMRNADAERTVQCLLPELAFAGRVVVPDQWAADPLVGEMAIRLSFSALCDADFLDTAAHFAGVDRPSVRDDADFGVLATRFEEHRTQLIGARASVSAVDPIRAEVYQACVSAAKSPPGIFRLAAPTGSGKTLAAGGFALNHAAAHGLRRVVVAVPFLTITEQNAGIYRQLLDDPGLDPVVLEHHSQVNLDDAGVTGRWWRLAAENWDVPFVVTTTVRLFEALFGRKPSAMRRVHRLAGAVIVLDEVQALPHRLLVPILDALRVLVTHFGTTVLLSSATQPEFWDLGPFRDLAATEIMPEPVVLASRLRRVRFEWRTDPSPTLDEVAEDAADRPQAMVVLNTTADAAKVYHRWSETGSDGEVWHLSTRMCPAHRRRVLDTVRVRLAEGQPTRLVSTQLIEAGVDVDFPVVYRALAPADSLLQAAGRANREGNLPEPGLVILVDPSDAGRPPSYKMLVNATRVCFGPSTADPDDLDALGRYYRSIYQVLNLEHPDQVGQRIQAARRDFDFWAVTEGPVKPIESGERDRTYAFRMITDDGINVVTPQGGEDTETCHMVESLVEHVRTAPKPDMSAFRQLQPYITTVHRSALSRPGVLALLRPILGQPGEPGSLAEWIGDYDGSTGITLDPRTEDFVV